MSPLKRRSERARARGPGGDLGRATSLPDRPGGPADPGRLGPAGGRVASIKRRLLATPLLVLGAAALTFGAAAPPEHCPDVSAADLDAAARAATAWIVDHQQPDGTWLYEYDRVTGRAEYFATGDYNIVRHAGVMLSLYQAAGHGHDGALTSADRGLDWALAHTVERHGWLGVTTNDSVQAGTNALLTAALVERRQVTGESTHDALLEQLGRFLAGQVEPNGAVLGYYDLGPDRPRPGVYSIYYTGETWWALARLHGEFPDAGWGDVADRIGHYLATERDHTEDLWPPLADHWSGYGLGETAGFADRPAGEPLTEAEVAFARRQAGLIGQRVRSISQRYGPWGTLVRGTFEPRGGGYGVFGEGLGGLWRASQLDSRLADLREPLARRQTCVVGLAIDAQESPAEAAAYRSPDQVAGAWFQNDVTRMDDQQHALSALLATIPILDSPAEITGTEPAAWLWAIVVLGVLNPIRGTLALRRAPGGIPAPQLAVGALGGGLVLFGVGALSGWLLDALDVSQPSMRLAAAGLCALAAAVDVIRARPPASEPPSGWLAAVTPVAIPHVVRTALPIAGLSVVADHGLGAYGLVLLVSVGLLILGVSAPARRPATPDAAHRDASDEPPSPASAVLAWLARLCSVLAFAAALLLVTHAVFDV